MRYEVKPDGTLSSGKVFFDMTSAEGEDALDGMKSGQKGTFACSKDPADTKECRQWQEEVVLLASVSGSSDGDAWAKALAIGLPTRPDGCPIPARP